MTDQIHKTEQPGYDWQATYGNCLRCGSQLQDEGDEEFRVGGSSGVSHLFLGNLADVGEDKMSLDLLSCPTCGMVELRVPRG
jgi:DNA-directed RNA polymerase subunit RPC12/RpoP